MNNMKVCRVITGFLLMILLWGFVPRSSDDIRSNDFKNPTGLVRVHTWWHWVDGRITREGITKDLESMKQQGIAQATILNVSMYAGNDLGVERIVFNSDEWYNMFRWALQEAKRLGITIGVHNCDGWSESGGPWITPETSMKKFVFTKTRVHQGQGTIKLPQPQDERGFYRDVAVLAFRNKSIDNVTKPQYTVSVNDTLDGAALTDGDPESKMEIRKNDGIQIVFQEKTEKSKIALLLNYKGAFYFPGPKKIGYTLLASEDGETYQKILEFETNRFYVTETINFPKTKARFFKLEVSNIFNLRPWHHAALAEVELLNDNEQPVYNPSILYPIEKTASARILDPDILYQVNKDIDVNRVIPKNSILNLTSQLQADGTLNWNVPEGNWSVIRFGYTTTGAENGPATVEGRGLECDKMDTAAVNLHFQNFPQKLVNQAKEFIGNSFQFLLIDSWERGYQTWTQAMPDEFEKLRGYDMTSWIPVLCGETVENSEMSEGFLYDFRKTVADLIEQNYYKHFSELCHQNGLKLHGEVIYGDDGPFPPIDVLRTNGYMDMPMYEYWSEQNALNLVEYKPGLSRYLNFPAYTANFYNTPVVGAEAYTGFAHYSESPSDLKLFGDKAYCSGMNQMILHSYVHQPVDREPGLTLGQHGSHFNRNNPVWKYSKGWMDYQSRIQAVLQKGKISAGILYYLGDQYPQFFRNKTVESLPKTYQAVPCNLDVLEKLLVQKGRLIFSKEQEFRILILPDHNTMDYTTLQEIARLIREGAVVYGDRPEQQFSLSGIADKEQFRELVDKIWKDYNQQGTTRNPYGKGTIIWNEPIAKVLAEFRLAPDFTTHQPDSLNLMYIHKNTENTDVFFVVNQQDTELKRDCHFRTKGNIPEKWDPLTGQIEKITDYSVENGQVRIPVTFKPRESLFFVFRKGKPAATTSPMKAKSPEVTEISGFKGKITFHPVNYGKPDSIEISGLKSLTEFQEPYIRYFSGKAHYRIDFDLPAGYSNKGNSVFLNLGNLDATAEVRLNNEFLGNVWMPNTMLPVGKLLKGKNWLEVTVATTCRNRIIGDLKQYGTLQSLWTTAPVTNFLNKDATLKPSGIIGPLQLVKY